MSNKNRDTKPLEGEYTVENNLTPDEAADRFANKWPHVAMKCARESFLSGYNWKNEQYTERVEGETISDAKDLAAKRHGYADWYQIQCLEIEPWEKEEIRANLVDDVASFYGLLIEHKIRKQFSTTPPTSTTIEALLETILDNYTFEKDFEISKNDLMKLMQAAYNLRDKEQAGAVLNTNDLYVTTNWVTAEVRNVYLDRKEADKATNDNSLGSYVTLKLSEYLESILSWYKPELQSGTDENPIKKRIAELHDMCQQTEDWQLQEKYEYAATQLTHLLSLINK